MKYKALSIIMIAIGIFNLAACANNSSQEIQTQVSSIILETVENQETEIVIKVE